MRGTGLGPGEGQSTVVTELARAALGSSQCMEDLTLHHLAQMCLAACWGLCRWYSAWGELEPS